MKSEDILMNIIIEQTQEEDIPALTKAMTHAFDHDAQVHLGVEKGGPEGYDDGGFFRKWLFSYDESDGYKILLDDEVIGGIIVWVFEHHKNRVGVIFVDPDYQDHGIGATAWRFIEQAYLETESWTLGTPSWAVKNHYFYERKCGFTKIGEEEPPDRSGVSFIYQKVMK
ncbi:MAG: GNAT family N-acetyltransferase [Chloroflexota bacterium]|nr:GNAT family N-acetyltransferase [Chloroflexota bacterium]